MGELMYTLKPYIHIAQWALQLATSAVSLSNTLLLYNLGGNHLGITCCKRKN